MSAPLEAALSTHVTTTSAVTALISTRFYPAGDVPQNPTYPLATYHRVSGTRTANLGGASGLADPRYQISAVDTTYLGARGVLEELRKAVSGYQGLMGSLEVKASVAIDGPDIPYDDVRLKQSSFDVFLTHQEQL